MRTRRLLALLVVALLALPVVTEGPALGRPGARGRRARANRTKVKKTPRCTKRMRRKGRCRALPKPPEHRIPLPPVPAPPPPPPSPPPLGGTPGPGTDLAGCPVFPADNPWNQDVSGLPVHANSANFVANVNSSGGRFLHADFGSNTEWGIPFATVPGTQPRVPITFTAYGDESDPGPYPVPLDAPIEGGPAAGGDRHALVIDTGACVLYELYRAFPNGTGWDADSGAVFNLRSNALRPDGWTSTDAAGLPIFPGLVRYDEVTAGEITHALRFTVERTQRGYVHPATHFASDSTDPNRPPMGLRLRLRADYDVSRFTGQARVILVALKRYGMIVADNGSNWFITGATDARWPDEDLDQLKTVPGAAFEVVDTGPVRN